MHNIYLKRVVLKNYKSHDPKEKDDSTVPPYIKVIALGIVRLFKFKNLKSNFRTSSVFSRLQV